MDKHLDARFERVEKALANLIDSIAKYNPSEKSVEELTVADRELNQGLHELETHQANHSRIQQLRHETAALDAQIKSTTSTLWTMRKEITATPTTTYPADFPKYEVTTAELLNYARRISRNTVPSMTLIEPDDGTATPPGQDSSRPSAEPPSGPMPNASFNGTGASASASAAATPPTGMNGGDALASQQTGDTALPEQLKEATSIGDGSIFIPWPADEVVRQGSLMENQRLRDAGVEPRGYDPEEEERRKQEAEQARKEEEERARAAREEAERKAREERERMIRERAARQNEEASSRRGSVMGGLIEGASPVQAAPRQFHFMDDLDDEDEED